MESFDFAQIQALRTNHFKSKNSEQDSIEVAHVVIKQLNSDGETSSVNGIIFQRCGGGRRVIKKKIGGN